MKLDPVATEVKSFYEETPFPNYDDFDNAKSLEIKAEKSIFAKMLNHQIPKDARVIEIGCGTGQLTNYLSICGRKVIGTDITENSLKLARDFSEKNNLASEFVQMDLFNPSFPFESFDYVISNGVLHHTRDTREAFNSIARLVKPGGFILIGLYNTYGRLFTNIRQFIFKLTGGRLKEKLDSHLADTTLSEGKKKAWFRDQYQHPHERKHTIGEVLKWFDEEGFEFMSGIPPVNVFDSFGEGTRMFKPHSRGNIIHHFLVQLKLFLVGAKEGGFYIMIGKKK
jgi:ubiquinone/menaquinone biosynthesis C-methylase UbiE